MRKTLILFLMLMSSGAAADEAGCVFTNAAGDTFTLTDNHFVWDYRPSRGSEELCDFGIDMDRGFTVTCPAHDLDVVVQYYDGYAIIGDERWSRKCPAATDAVNLGL